MESDDKGKNPRRIMSIQYVDGEAIDERKLDHQFIRRLHAAIDQWIDPRTRNGAANESQSQVGGNGRDVTSASYIFLLIVIIACNTCCWSCLINTPLHRAIVCLGLIILILSAAAFASTKF